MITTTTLIVTFTILTALIVLIIAGMILDLCNLNNLRKQNNTPAQRIRTLMSMSIENDEWMKDLRRRAWAELKEEV